MTVFTSSAVSSTFPIDSVSNLQIEKKHNYFLFIDVGLKKQVPKSSLRVLREALSLLKVIRSVGFSIG
jgi:hypothetical protein